MSSGGEGEGGGVSESKDSDLEEEWSPISAEEEEAEDKEDVIKAFGDDMDKSLFKEAEEGLPAVVPRGGGGDGWWWGDCGGEVCEVEGEAGFVWKENSEFCLGLIVQQIGENHGEWGSGEGADFPSSDACGDGGGPLSGEDNAWGVFGERDAGWLGEIKSEFGLNSADGLEKKLETFLKEGGDLGADFGLSLGGQSSENFFGEVGGCGWI